METGLKLFDLTIIGSGPGGYFSAIVAAQKGLSVAIIEKGELGGICLNRGCIPTKTLLKEASLWDAFSRSGWVKGKDDLALHFRKAMEKKERAVQQVVSGLRGLLHRDRITLILGEASFMDSQNLLVTRDGEIVERIGARNILIATGAVPKEVPQVKRDGRWVMGSDDVLKMGDLPSTIAIVGGGRRGVEFATFFNTFGVKVTLIEKESRILPKMDREISVRYRGLLTKSNVKVLTEAEAIAANLVEEDNLVNLTLLHKGREEKLTFEKILMVGDRQAYTEGLDLHKIPLSLKEGFIEVDPHMRTSFPKIYAAGDVTGRGFLAHKAFQEGRVAVENILGRAAQTDYRFIPICLYGFPEAASVGLSEERARESQGEIRVGKFPFMGCGRAIATGEQEGMVKIVSEPKYGEILGVHILGPGATEIIHLGAMAMKNEMVVKDIEGMIFAHPTFSEAFFEAALDTHGEAIHMIKA